jgi:hypothetical protein
MRTEDDIRTALRTLADEAPDASTVLSRSLSGAPTGRSRSRTGRRAYMFRILTPALAAAAVLAVIATSIAIGTSGHAGDDGARSGQSTVPSPAVSSSAPHGSGLPSYYVAIMSLPNLPGLVTTVRDTRTGASLATVHPPAGYWFIDAAPGAGNDSFLLIANQHHGPPGLYLMRFEPADRHASLTRLPIAVTLDTGGLAMSPTGTEVAVASGTNTGKVPSELRIYTLSGRLIRHWQDPGTICLTAGLPCLSWAASGYLAFGWNNNDTNPAVEGIRLIRASAASGSLLGASRLVVPFKTAQTATSVLSGNGTALAVGVPLRSRSRGSYMAVEEFSTATGKLIGRFSSTPQIQGEFAFWSNWTGSELIVLADFSRPSRSPRPQFGTVTRTRFASLAAIPPGSWLTFAF